MPQFYNTGSNPAYVQAGVNLSEAIFGKPKSVQDSLRNELLAANVGGQQRKNEMLSNELEGQNTFKEMMSGINGDLNNVDGGSLAAAIGLANINPRAFTALSLDPRHGEMDQRRATVASGAEPSMGSIAADIGLVDATTTLRNAQTAKTMRSGSGSGGRGYKPPQLVPSNVEKIQNAAIQNMGLDEGRLKNTIAQNQSLGTAILDIINNANTEGMGNSAYTQARVQDLLSDVIGEETGGWKILPGTQGDKRYEVRTDALSSILNGDVPQEVISQKAPVQNTIEAPSSEPRQAPDGNYYIPDPNRPGKYLRVDPQ